MRYLPPTKSGTLVGGEPPPALLTDQLALDRLGGIGQNFFWIQLASNQELQVASEEVDRLVPPGRQPEVAGDVLGGFGRHLPDVLLVPDRFEGAEQRTTQFQCRQVQGQNCVQSIRVDLVGTELRGVAGLVEVQILEPEPSQVGLLGLLGML